MGPGITKCLSAPCQLPGVTRNSCITPASCGYFDHTQRVPPVPPEALLMPTANPVYSQYRPRFYLNACDLPLSNTFSAERYWHRNKSTILLLNVCLINQYFSMACATGSVINTLHTDLPDVFTFSVMISAGLVFSLDTLPNCFYLFGRNQSGFQLFNEPWIYKRKIPEIS